MDVNESPILFDHVIYLESNVWPILASPASATLVTTLKRKHTIVASTITATELLRAPLAVRKKLALPFCDLVTLPLLEPPLMLAEAAATAFILNDAEYELSPTEQSRTIYAALCGLTDDPNVKGVDEWIAAMHEDVDRFIADVRPSKPDPQSYTRSEIVQRDDFIDLLRDFPAARKLRLTRQQMQKLLGASDIWMRVTTISRTARRL